MDLHRQWPWEPWCNGAQCWVTPRLPPVDHAVFSSTSERQYRDVQASVMLKYRLGDNQSATLTQIDIIGFPIYHRQDVQQRVLYRSLSIVYSWADQSWQTFILICYHYGS